MIEQRGNSNSGMSNQEVFKMIDRYHAPDKVIQQTEVKVDAAETKIITVGIEARSRCQADDNVSRRFKKRI